MVFSAAFATVALSFLSLVNAQISLPIAAIEAHFTNAGIVPSLLHTFDPSATLNVTFTGVGAINPGQPLSKNQVAAAPQLAITPANSTVTFSGNYTVVMADADIVGTDESGGQTRHWLVNDVPIANGNVTVTSGKAITSYAGPGPAPGSGAHRYVILVLPQPSDFQPPANLSNTNTPVSKFDLNAYITSSKLGQPIAGMYFTVEEGTATVTVSATQPVNTASLAASLSAASATASTGASAKKSSASAVEVLSMPMTLFASFAALLFI